MMYRPLGTTGFTAAARPHRGAVNFYRKDAESAPPDDMPGEVL